MGKEVHLTLSEEDYRRVHHAVLETHRRMDIPQYRDEFLALIKKIDEQGEPRQSAGGATELRDALEYAVDVIEQYETDIRNGTWTGVDLVAAGFCQGAIYRRAIHRIRKLAGDVERQRFAFQSAIKNRSVG